MKTLGDLFDAADERAMERREYLLGKNPRKDLKGIWTPEEAKRQLQRAQSVQRRAFADPEVNLERHLDRRDKQKKARRRWMENMGKLIPGQ